jgi:anti-anti-sigma regulatory factor/HAMP domain-containing protein
MIAFFTAAIGGAIFFSIYLTRPISEMVSATQAVGQGDLSRTIQVSSRDELGTLASSFNQMTRELETAHKELEKSHETLEQTVAERTEALRRESEESARLKDEVMQQAKAMLDMSTPLIPVSDDVIVMPIVGSLSTDRSQQVLETLLQGVSAHRSRIVIIDITGILVVDTAVAQTLIEATQAVRLLGTHVILTGIRPDVAQTLVQLGIDLGAIITCNTLQSGIERARQMTRASMSMN